MSAERRRVALTGIGLVTPLGVGTEETWQGLVEARSAVGPIEGYDASSLRSQLGAEIVGLEPKQFVSRRALRTMTRYDVLANCLGSSPTISAPSWERSEEAS